MALNARFVYMPRPTKGLKFLRSQFRSSYPKTLNYLERELNYLKAHSVTVQAGFPSDRIRNDGWPYSSARPEHPAVVLHFMRGKELFSFRSLKFASFEENLRAIGLTMEALRSVDRYGVVEGEQYQGFKQIAAPSVETSRLEKLIQMRDRAATEGERQAAQAAIDRVQAAGSGR